MADQEFREKIVVVTGGSRGIGRAIADAFASEGATVVTLARHDATIAVDMTDENQVATAFGRVGDEYGRVDVLINNAGGARPGPAATYPAKLARQAFELNVVSTLIASQYAYAMMTRATGTSDASAVSDAPGGSIVNIGSVSATRGSPGTALYGAAKAALSALTKSLALEWAPHVRVNGVVCGPVLTEPLIAYYGGPEGAALRGAEMPLGRVAEPQDVAEACLFLASSRAAYVSGAELLVHGGGEMPQFNRNH